MKKRKLFINAKQVVAVLFLCIAIFFIVALFLLRDQLTDYTSKAMKAQVSTQVSQDMANYIDSSYNYMSKGESYKATFLEFGATGCSTCKRMESVMEEIKHYHGKDINVVFVHVLKNENRRLMKYFGVATIPTQVLLNKKGKEFYRHSGFITPEEIVKEVDRIK